MRCQLRFRDLGEQCSNGCSDGARPVGCAIVFREALNDEVVAYARRIAENAPLTIRAAKAAVAVFERGSRSDEITEVQRKVNACFDSDDYKEGRRAFMEKRPPKFNGK